MIWPRRLFIIGIDRPVFADREQDRALEPVFGSKSWPAWAAFLRPIFVIGRQEDDNACP